MTHRIHVLLAACLGTGCVADLDHEAPRSRAGHVVADCVVPLPAALAGHGAPAASLELPGQGSLWLWDDARAWVTSADAACGGELTPLAGAPVPLLPEEEAANAARSDGRRIATAPRGGFVEAGRGTLYFDLQLRGPGLFDVVPLGTGLCEVTDPAKPCVRSGALLWTTAPARGGPGFVDDDGRAYLFRCAAAAALEEVCTAARVAPARAADAAAYELAAAFGGWNPEPGTPGAALHGTDLITVFHSPRLRRYAAVSRDVWVPELRIAVADAPEGPYGSATRLFRAKPPPSFFIGGGLEHAALRGDEGRLVLSYSSGSELHLVTFELDPEDWP